LSQPPAPALALYVPGLHERHAITSMSSDHPALQKQSLRFVLRAGELECARHIVHEAGRVNAAYVPGRQSSQTSVPFNRCVPVMHMQSPLSVLAGKECAEIPQLMQGDKPVDSLNFPAGQAVQAPSWLLLLSTDYPLLHTHTAREVLCCGEPECCGHTVHKSFATCVL